MKIKILSLALAVALQCQLMNGSTEAKKLKHTSISSNKEHKVKKHLTVKEYIEIGKEHRRVRTVNKRLKQEQLKKNKSL